jgi:hypothetical protein
MPWTTFPDLPADEDRYLLQYRIRDAKARNAESSIQNHSGARDLSLMADAQLEQVLVASCSTRWAERLAALGV